MNHLYYGDNLSGKSMDFPKMTGSNKTFKAAKENVKVAAEKLDLFGQ